MQVREICSSPIQTIAANTKLADAAECMRKYDVSSLAVTTKGEIIGIITERDLVQAISDRTSMLTAPVSSYMTADLYGADGELDASDAASLMLEKGVRHMPVYEGSEMIGMLSTRDLLLLEAWPPA